MVQLTALYAQNQVRTKPVNLDHGPSQIGQVLPAVLAQYQEVLQPGRQPKEGVAR